MNKAFRNIETIQKQVKDSINNLLVENGYSLYNEEKFGDRQSLLLQWTNEVKKHTLLKRRFGQTIAYNQIKISYELF
jgi:hypothetical protein